MLRVEAEVGARLIHAHSEQADSFRLQQAQMGGPCQEVRCLSCVMTSLQAFWNTRSFSSHS